MATSLVPAPRSITLRTPVQRLSFPFAFVLVGLTACVHAPGPSEARDVATHAPASSATAKVSAPSAEQGAPNDLQPPLAPVTPSPDVLKVDALMRAMTLEQKVGQVMMVGFKGAQVDQEVRTLLRERRVGGVCMFKRNISGAEQIARLNDEIRALSEGGVPPFIALDQEGGNVVRIQDRNVVLPGNMALGATHSPQLAYQAGRAQAEDLMLLGFNMNLAPVLDVNVNPKNPVIGIRSFGDRPEVVGSFGVEFVRGQQDANIVTIAKHFPGHGNTDADSHRALPVMTETREELMGQLIPFERVIDEGLDGLMTAHVAIPKVTGHGHPATLSEEILTGLLRKQLRFGGLVVTDELEMEAIAEHYGVGRAAVLSLKAGADMVLVPWRPEKKTEVYEAVLEAAQRGELPMDRLDDAVRRILHTKVRRGLFEAPPPVKARLALLGQSARLQIPKEIARQSVTLLRTDGRSFPIKRKKRIGVLTAEAALGRAISKRAKHAEVVVVPAWPDSETRAELRQTARELALQSEVIVVGLINARQVDLVMMAAATGRPVIVISMGLPYLMAQVDEARAVLAVYSYQDSSAEAAAAALFGEQATPGRLPVTLNETLTFGYGLDATGRPLGAATVSAPVSATGPSAGVQ